MILIFGGAYQGKLDFARERFGEAKTVCTCAADGKLSGDADIIYGWHELVLGLIRAGVDPVSFTKERLPRIADKIVICDDISSGVVPVDPELRAWREAIGRCMGLLAGNSDEVWRVFCGIGTRIK